MTGVTRRIRIIAQNVKPKRPEIGDKPGDNMKKLFLLILILSAVIGCQLNEPLDGVTAPDPADPIREPYCITNEMGAYRCNY